MVNDVQTNIIIPIQGTFDIAKARNTIRTKISAQDWPADFSFIARASTAMTALGEMILLGDATQSTQVFASFCVDDTKHGIKLHCTLPNPTSDHLRWESKVDNLRQMADELDIEQKGNKISVQAVIWQ